MATINRVVLVGNLTRDPGAARDAGGTSVCRLRIACNTSWRNKETGEIDERPNYFDVTVFGASGEACARFLAKGRPVAVDGRLDWHEWETADGERRQAVGIVADSVQFLARAPARARSGEDAEVEAEEAGGDRVLSRRASVAGARGRRARRCGEPLRRRSGALSSLQDGSGRRRSPGDGDGSSSGCA